MINDTKLSRLMYSKRIHYHTLSRSQYKISYTKVKSHSLFQSYRAVLPTSLKRVYFSPKISNLRDRMRLSVRLYIIYNISFLSWDIKLLLNILSYPNTFLLYYFI